MSDNLKQVLVRMTPATIRLADRAAGEQGLSRSAWVSQVVEQAAANLNLVDPGLVLGYWQVFDGDVDTDDTCPACEYPMAAGVFVGVTQAGRIIGPFCNVCAGQE